MRLGTLCIHQWRYISIPFPLVLWFVKKQSQNYGTVLELHLLISLQYIGGWVSLSTQRRNQRIVKNWLKNWGSASISSLGGITRVIIQLFGNIISFCIKLRFAVETTCVNLENLSKIMGHPYFQLWFLAASKNMNSHELKETCTSKQLMFPIGRHLGSIPGTLATFVLRCVDIFRQLRLMRMLLQHFVHWYVPGYPGSAGKLDHYMTWALNMTGTKVWRMP